MKSNEVHYYDLSGNDSWQNDKVDKYFQLQYKTNSKYHLTGTKDCPLIIMSKAI
jgi:16S rRNA G527 N7-methylase RsmG